MSDQETSTPEQEPDQVTSEEQNIQKTVRGVRSYMGGNQVPEFVSSASSQDDSPFSDPRSQSTGKSFSNYHLMPDFPWKLEKLNLIFTEGYLTLSTDNNGLPKGQFVIKVPHKEVV